MNERHYKRIVELEHILEEANASLSDQKEKPEDTVNFLLGFNGNYPLKQFLIMVDEDNILKHETDGNYFYMTKRNFSDRDHFEHFCAKVRDRLNRNNCYFKKDVLNGNTRLHMFQDYFDVLIDGEIIEPYSKTVYRINNKEFFLKELNSRFDEKMPPKDTYNYFLKAGIPKSRLNKLRGMKDEQAKMLEAGKLFFDCGFHDFNLMDLGLIMYGNRKNVDAKKRVLKLFKERYGDNKSRMPAIHRLRSETGNYDGNYPAAKDRYPFIEAGRKDLREGVRLPIKISLDEERWIGILLGDGRVKSRNDAGEGEAVELDGFFEDIQLYRTVVPYLAWKVHNYDSSAGLREIKGTDNVRPNFLLSSKMITSWAENYIFSNYGEYRNRKGVLEGIVATKGLFKDTGRFYITSSDKEFSTLVGQLLESQGLHAKIWEKRKINEGRVYTSYDVALTVEDCKKMVQKIKLINPKHIAVLKSRK
jgi:hypothetical protein